MSVLDLFTISSTSALLSGVYGRGLNAGVRGDGGGVWTPGDPKGSRKPAQRRGKYSKETMVSP